MKMNNKILFYNIFSRAKQGAGGWYGGAMQSY